MTGMTGCRAGAGGVQGTRCGRARRGAAGAGATGSGSEERESLGVQVIGQSEREMRRPEGKALAVVRRREVGRGGLVTEG